MLSPNLISSQTSVSEDDLKIPTLLVLAKASQAKVNGLTVNTLADALESINLLSPADQEVTPGDRVSRFRRQVLNLISHGTLEKAGWVKSKPPTRGQMTQRLVITAAGRSRLAQVAISGIGMPRVARPPLSPTSRTLEKSIALPALFVLANLEMAMERPVPMTTLRTSLHSVLPKSEADMVVLKNRTDTRLDQVIRNLISHNTLQNEKWVKRTTEGMSVTNAGYAALLDHLIGTLPTPPMFASQAEKADASAPAADKEDPTPARRASPRPR